MGYDTDDENPDLSPRSGGPDGSSEGLGVANGTSLDRDLGKGSARRGRAAAGLGDDVARDENAAGTEGADLARDANAAGTEKIGSVDDVARDADAGRTEGADLARDANAAASSGDDLAREADAARNEGTDLVRDANAAAGSRDDLARDANAAGIKAVDSGTDPADTSTSDLAEEERAAAAAAVAPWVGFVFVCGGVAVVPWAGYLAATLPRTSESAHYRLAWVGFDLLLAITLFRIGWIAGRGPTQNDRVELPATSAATLLLVDAWFDTTTSATTGALVAALILAAVAELPMAALCFWIAHHAEEIRERRLRLLPVLERLVRR